MTTTNNLTRRAQVSRVLKMKTVDDLEELLPYSHPLTWFRPGRKILVADKMQSRYSYTLTALVGKDFDPDFKPQMSPAQMLKMGVFEGKYVNDGVLEFPREWYLAALKAGKLCPGKPNPKVNEFGVKSRKSLAYWKRQGWIPVIPKSVGTDHDVRGWFQWYCRYYIGRRDPKVDEKQISRWKSFVRHVGQIKASYSRLSSVPKTRAQKRSHRSRQRQALLQWAYNPYV